MTANAKALKANDAEWSKLWDRTVWDATVVKSWHQVASEARRSGKYVRLGKLFGICVEKGAELDDDGPRKKYKHRLFCQGNRVVDQNMDEAQFQDMGSAPATIEASRMCIMKGFFKG